MKKLGFIRKIVYNYKKGEKNMSYVITRPSDVNGKLPVLIVDDHGEIMEFEVKEKAEYVVKVLKSNDSQDREYTVKKIG
jgi:hypothetical protein